MAQFDLQATTASLMTDSAYMTGGQPRAKQQLEIRSRTPRAHVGRLAYPGYCPTNDDASRWDSTFTKKYNFNKSPMKDLQLPDGMAEKVLHWNRFLDIIYHVALESIFGHYLSCCIGIDFWTLSSIMLLLEGRQISHTRIVWLPGTGKSGEDGRIVVQTEARPETFRNPSLSLFLQCGCRWLLHAETGKIRRRRHV